MKKTLHFISQAHLDPVWLWPLRDGCAEALTTLQSAVDRASEIDDFRFTRSSAAVYRWVKEMDPRLWSSIMHLVRENRWEVIGGWVEQPDCNLPSAESFIRQGIFGGDFFRKELNARTRVGYNVDSFGHSGGLPQILKKSGLDYYVFTRPMPGDNADIPLLFWWESADGSRVLAQRIPQGYSQSYGARASDVERYIRGAVSENFSPGFSDGVFFFGVGNHGGGPTREHLQLVQKLQRDPSLPEIRFSTMEEYFLAIESSPAYHDLPVIRGELQFHARGCYSSTGEVKRLHRAAEKALYLAESVTAQHGAGNIDCISNTNLAEAWWKLLFNQFHDILAGTCIPQTQAETRHRFGATLDAASEATTKAVYSMARNVNTREEKGSVLFVNNPLPWPRVALVQFDTFISPHDSEEITHLETEDGQYIPLQWMSADATFGPWLLPWGKLTAAVDLPAGGYRVFRVGTKSLPLRDTAIPIEQFVLDQLASKSTPDRLISVDPALPSLKLSPSREEVLSSEIGLVVIEDLSDAWGHDHSSYEVELGRPQIVSTQVMEDGDLVSVTRQKMKWRSSEIFMDVIRYQHSPDIEMSFRINWQEKRQMLKLEVPTNLVNTTTYAKMVGEVVARPADGSEYPCQDWVALEGSYHDGSTATVALLNDSSYSYSAKEGVLRTVLARTAPFAEHRPINIVDEDVPFMDQGWQERRFWLVASKAAVSNIALDRLALDWQTPAQHMFDSGHEGAEGWQNSFFEVEPANVSVLALKPADDGNGVILRVQEMSGELTETFIRWKGSRSKFNLTPWEIRTWRLSQTGKADTIEESSLNENAPKLLSGVPEMINVPEEESIVFQESVADFEEVIVANSGVK